MFFPDIDSLKFLTPEHEIIGYAPNYDPETMAMTITIVNMIFNNSTFNATVTIQDK